MNSIAMARWPMELIMHGWLVRANTLKPNASGVLDVDYDTIEEQQEWI